MKGLNHEYMGSTGAPPAAWQGPKTKKNQPTANSANRLTHRNSDTPGNLEGPVPASTSLHAAANVPNPTDAILALNESARDVSTIGTFAPSTSPAHSPPPTYTKLL